MRYSIMTPSVMAEHCYAECHLCCLSLMLSVRFKPLFAEYLYAECRGAVYSARHCICCYLLEFNSNTKFSKDAITSASHHYSWLINKHRF